MATCESGDPFQGLRRLVSRGWVGQGKQRRRRANPRLIPTVIVYDVDMIVSARNDDFRIILSQRDGRAPGYRGEVTSGGVPSKERYSRCLQSRSTTPMELFVASANRRIEAHEPFVFNGLPRPDVRRCLSRSNMRST